MDIKKILSKDVSPKSLIPALIFCSFLVLLCIGFAYIGHNSQNVCSQASLSKLCLPAAFIASIFGVSIYFGLAFVDMSMASLMLLLTIKLYKTLRLNGTSQNAPRKSNDE
jgi:hypothetical protein